MALVARYAMMSIVPTLLVAVVTFIAIMSSACPPATGGGLGCCAVSRFVCFHCTSTGKPPSRRLFLARAASGGSPPPHQCYKILSRGRPWLSGGICQSQGRPATSLPERVARQGRRRTFDTSHQVTQSVVSKKKSNTV